MILASGESAGGAAGSEEFIGERLVDLDVGEPHDRPVPPFSSTVTDSTWSPLFEKTIVTRATKALAASGSSCSVIGASEATAIRNSRCMAPKSARAHPSSCPATTFIIGSRSSSNGSVLPVSPCQRRPEEPATTNPVATGSVSSQRSRSGRR